MNLKNKKAQANILLILLIIVIILLLIIVLWNIVYSTTKTSGGKVSIEQFKVKLAFDKENAVTIDNNIITVKVYRGTGKGDLKAIKFIFKDDLGNQEIIERNTPLPKELETETYTFDTFTILNIEDITKVSFIPMFEDDNGEDIYGMGSDEVEIELGEPCITNNDCDIGETCEDGKCEIPDDCFDPNDNPIKLCTCTDLQRINEDLTKEYILDNNINCEGFENFEPLGIFTGILDGDYHYIYGLEMKMPKDIGGGLFNEISSGAIVKNLGLREINFYSLEDSETLLCKMGGITPLNKGTIINCYIKGGSIINQDSNSYNYLGGLVGKNQGLIKESYTNIIIKGKKRVGGLVGESSNGGIIKNCYFLGNVSGIEKDSAYAGEYIGGLIGITQYGSEIINCYSAGFVEGKEEVGGLVGSRSGEITNSYSISSVNLIGGGSYAGGLIGNNPRNDLWTNNWWYNDTLDNTANCIGYGQTVTCNEIININYFYSNSNPPMNSWDFTPYTGIWKETDTFPIFQWQSLV